MGFTKNTKGMVSLNILKCLSMGLAFATAPLLTAIKIFGAKILDVHLQRLVIKKKKKVIYNRDDSSLHNLWVANWAPRRAQAKKIRGLQLKTNYLKEDIILICKNNSILYSCFL